MKHQKENNNKNNTQYILFRGQKRHSKTWIYGVPFLTKSGKSVIITEWKKPLKNGIQFVKVKPKTITRYTGYKDLNGQLIFQGDILKDKEGTLFTVYYVANQFHAGSRANFIDFDSFYNDYEDIEIINNIFNKPKKK